MTKREAYRIGQDVGCEIVLYGDFTAEEKADREKFLAACWECAENRKQYADDVTYDFRRDAEWEGYEAGVTAGVLAEAKRLFPD